MSGTLATSVFQAGANDKNLTVDGYGVKDTTTRNSVLDVLNTFGADAAAAIKKNPGTIDRLKATIDQVKSGRLSATDMLTRASSVLGGLAGPVKNLSSSVSGMLVDNLSSLGLDRDNTATTLNAIIAGVPIAVQARTTDLNGIAGLTNALTRDPATMKVIDQVGETAVLSTVTQYAVSNGMPELLTTAVNAASSSTVANSVLRQTTGAALTSGDLRSIQKITTTLGGAQVRADHPTATQQLATNYKIPSGTTTAGLSAQGTELSNTLTMLDPSWYQVGAGGDGATKLSVFQNASPDTLKVLGTQPQYQNEIAIASSYTPTTATSLIGGMYPSATLF